MSKGAVFITGLQFELGKILLDQCSRVRQLEFSFTEKLITLCRELVELNKCFSILASYM